MFVSLAGLWWPDRPIVCWLEMWYPNIQKWSFSRWNTCNIGVESFSIWGCKASEANFNMWEGIAKCTYTHICMHIHMNACTRMYMLINTYLCLHTHVCMHAHAYACIHLYIFCIFTSWYENHLNPSKGFLREKKTNKYIHVIEWGSCCKS